MKKLFKYLALFFLITFLLSIILIAINYNKLKIKYLSHNTGYQESTISILLEESIYDMVTDKEYSKTLDQITNTKYF